MLPIPLALAVAAFSLGSRPQPLGSSLAPDAFSGARAFSEMSTLAREYPDRSPGSPGDQALAAHIARDLQGLGGTAGGGFQVRTRSVSAQTVDGRRTLQTVIAERPGATNASPIAIVAHRDAAGTGARAELSGTAALLELAQVFATRETSRTIVLVSTSGGSGGDGGAVDFAALRGGSLDVAIVLGDLAAARSREPVVVPYSDGLGSAPLVLQRTVDDAIARETGRQPAAPSLLGQLAHLAFPYSVGEQGSLQQHGAPALLIQASGERGPTASEAVSEERLEALGRAALSSVDALDGAQDLESATQSSLLVQRKTFPEWALRLLVAALLAAPLLTAVDALARVRRRGIAVARWTIWTLTCALPFAACALFLRVLGGSGALPVAPTVPLPPAGLELDATSAAAIAAAASTLTLGWLLWPALVRRVGLRVAPDHEAAGVIALLVLLCAAVVVWAVNPFAALLIVPAAHAWLLLASPELRPRRGPALALVALGLLPLLALIAFYADALGLGVGKLLWSGALLFAGGHIGIAGSLVWAVVLGCAAAMTMVALREPPALREPEIDEEVQITMRGPLGYAGPGSLGGTESALRR
ncbi:MAG TPA: M28 family peptidase [Solirubrobacteraceae bacterium]|nr:M28 family peptidase [Solirubrobacteraceae bacterium]